MMKLYKRDGFPRINFLNSIFWTINFAILQYNYSYLIK